MKGEGKESELTIWQVKDNLPQFIKAWKRARGEDFTFMGHEFDSRHAEYLIEYLEGDDGRTS